MTIPVAVDTHDALLAWLRETDADHLGVLYAEADRVRQERVGAEVHLRGLIEFSNHCARACTYCGLRAANAGVERYRMPAEEILECARQARSFGYGTVVLQSGEDPGMTADWMAHLIRAIRAETGLAVTLSVGERSREDLAAWREAGADRYLLRFETSNAELFRRIHPPAAQGGRNRFDVLSDLRALGYEVGSGVMIGIPGQTYDDLARDLETFRELDLDMIGCGPWIEHPATPSAGMEPAPAGTQVPASEDMVYKVIALARLVCPDANIPATTALATLNKAQGRELGLARGANILMPNCTPVQYRRMYEIYPAKVCIDETAIACQGCMRRRVESIGRTVGRGAGPSRNLLRKSPVTPSS